MSESFAVESSSYYTASDDYRAFKAFDNEPTTLFYGPNNNYATLTFYNYHSIKVTNIQITNRHTGNCSALTGGNIVASNNNIDWIDIATFTNSNTGYSGKWDIPLNCDYYKCYKIIPTSYGPHSSYNTSIAEIEITANCMLMVL